MTERSSTTTFTERSPTEAVTPKGYKRTKVGVIPEDWEALPAKNYFEKSIEKGYDALEIYSVTLNKNWQKRSELEREIGSEVDVKKSLLARKGHLVYNTMRMWQGALGLAESTGVVSPAYVVLKPKEMIDPKFAFYQLKSYRYLHYLKSYSYGLTSDRLRLYFNDFGMIPFICPPLEEQKRIAQILGTWDKAIEKLEALITAKEELKRGLMQKLLSGEVRFKGFDEEWEEARLGDIAVKMKSGGTPKATNKDFYIGDIPFVKVSDVAKDGKYLINTQACITKEALQSSSAWLVPENSIIYSMYASIGFVKINKIQVATSQAMINIIPDLEKIDSEFLYYFLLYFKKYIHRYIETGTQGNLNAKIVKNIPIQLPSIQEQQKIVQTFTRVDKEIDLLKEEFETIKEQKRGLMQKLLTGETRVRVDKGERL